MFATEVHLAGAEAVLDNPKERTDAVRRAFECALPGTPEEFAVMVERGEARGWPEVARAGLYGLLRHAAEAPGGDPQPALRRFLERAQADGDFDMIALGLAWRAYLATTRHGDFGGMADEDLAKAAIMLEPPAGDPIVKTATHFRVAFSFWHRRMWELADEQSAAAEAMVDAVDPYRKDPLLHRAALAFNRVTVQLDWACALREVGDSAGLQARREAQLAAIAEAECIDMPEDWRTSIKVTALLVDVLCGLDRSREVDETLALVPAQENLKEWEPYLHLARSLNPDAVGLDEAARAADRAIGVWVVGDDPVESPECYLALHQAAVLEAAAAGRRTAGLRSAEALAAERERNRLSALAGMRAVIASERLRNERDVLARQAYADPLTGLANRRGYERLVASLQSSSVQDMALLLFDVDHFKPVNDRRRLGPAAPERRADGQRALGRFRRPYRWRRVPPGPRQFQPGRGCQAGGGDRRGDLRRKLAGHRSRAPCDRQFWRRRGPAGAGRRPNGQS
jgi:hypothetical protein